MASSVEALLQDFVRDRAHYLGLLRVMCRDAEMAEELFQELSVIVIRDIAKFDTARDFSAWVRGIARNVYRKSLEKARYRSRTHVSLDPELMEQILAVYDERDDREAATKSRWTALLRLCLDRLPDEQRAMLADRYERRLSSAEIGSVQKRSANAIDTILCRLRSILLECVERHARAAP
jgi:RNA polymerase sigma-70 factor (ECF subfamily)